MASEAKKKNTMVREAIVRCLNKQRDQQSTFQQTKCTQAFSMNKARSYSIIAFFVLSANFYGGPPDASHFVSNFNRVRTEALETTGPQLHGKFDRLLTPDERICLYVTEKESASELIGNSENSEKNFGSSEFKEGLLSIKWNQTPEPSSSVSSEYIAVEWSGCIILVDKSELPRFCRKARLNKDSVRTLCLSKCDGDIEDLKGRPVLPERFAKYWDLDPIDAKVLRLSDAELDRSAGKKTFLQQVVLDKGKLDHLYEGMKMQTVAIPLIDLTIIEVRDKSSVAMVKHTGRKPRLKEGTVFTTDF